MSDTQQVTAITTPEWVRHAVFYQIFPERFANGDPTNDPENVQPWGSIPTPKNYMGGDLQGIIERLDYLHDLGVTALYLNPIFHAHSNHKYNTYDYYQIDPHFGDMQTFHALLAEAHRRDMRVILDGVFNHCGRGFFAFNSVLENGSDSPYVSWFYIDQFPINAYDESKPSHYWGWWSLHSLPKFNTDHPPARQYLLDVARYWIEQGADGWRLDVPNEIKDHDFWREFRQVVKAANPDAYIVGEIWLDATPWLDGTQFDAVMNYLWRDLCRDFFARGTLSASVFAQGIDYLLHLYPPEVTAVQLNLLGSHDTARFVTEANDDTRTLYPVILFQMTYPGAPCIYYGDEIGMQGGDEPGSRGAFPWATQQWNHDLRQWVQDCVTVRHSYPALRTGAFRTLHVANDPPVYSFVRWQDSEQVIVVLNPGATALTLDLPVADLPLSIDTMVRDVLGSATYPITAGQIRGIRIAPFSGAVLIAHGDDE